VDPGSLFDLESSIDRLLSADKHRGHAKEGSSFPTRNPWNTAATNLCKFIGSVIALDGSDGEILNSAACAGVCG
jgi:hypothetical protein